MRISLLSVNSSFTRLLTVRKMATINRVITEISKPFSLSCNCHVRSIVRISSSRHWAVVFYHHQCLFASSLIGQWRIGVALRDVALRDVYIAVEVYSRFIGLDQCACATLPREVISGRVLSVFTVIVLAFVHEIGWKMQCDLARPD